MSAGKRPTFAYPTEPHHPTEPDQRRHKPPVRTDYRRYKEYLRDEFVFTCVYCLMRETWTGSPATFGVEHFHPKSKAPELISTYTNLLYVCNFCNSARGNRPMSPALHPEINPFGAHLEIINDGTVKHRTETGLALIDLLKLNRPEVVTHRLRMLKLYQLLMATRKLPILGHLSREALTLFFGFPQPMFDLSTQKGAVNPYCRRTDRPPWY
ncbi:MAG: hypothetical protein ACKVY0_26300 [Prosthecobacter sp.]|uniref:hypothetical protein n=1 Tax=Prosthecobacter sp. TaxID=1965333 RepID=UPI0039005516